LEEDLFVLVERDFDLEAVFGAAEVSFFELSITFLLIEKITAHSFTPLYKCNFHYLKSNRT